MHLEDASDLEIRQLKDIKSTLSNENKAFSAKVQHQGEQSMYLRMYLGTCIFVRMYVCVYATRGLLDVKMLQPLIGLYTFTIDSMLVS